MGPFQWDFSRLEQPFSVHVVACSSFPTHLYCMLRSTCPSARTSPGTSYDACSSQAASDSALTRHGST